MLSENTLMMIISLHLDIQAITICLPIGWEIHNNDFLFTAPQRTRHRCGQRGCRQHIPRGTTSCLKTPVKATDAAQSAVLEDCWTLHTSASQNRNHRLSGAGFHYRNLFTSRFSLTCSLLSQPSSGAGLYYRCAVRIWSEGRPLQQREWGSFEVKR